MDLRRYSYGQFKYDARQTAEVAGLGKKSHGTRGGQELDSWYKKSILRLSDGCNTSGCASKSHMTRAQTIMANVG